MFSRVSPWSFPLIVRSSCWAPSLHILLFQMSALAFSHYFFGFDPYHPSIFKINCLGKIIFFQAWSRMELLSFKKKKKWATVGIAVYRMPWPVQVARVLCPDTDDQKATAGCWGLVAWGADYNLGCTWDPCQALRPGGKEAQRGLLSQVSQLSRSHVCMWFHFCDP